MPNNQKLQLGLIAVLVSLMCSCSVEKWRAKPTAVGKPNEIAILWDSTALPRALRDSIIRYWEQPYIITPQVEPLFDLRWFRPDQLEADVYKRTLRTYFIPLSTEDTSSALHRLVSRYMDHRLLLPVQRVQLRQYRDIWAKGQIIIVLRAPNRQALIEGFVRLHPQIQSLIARHDADVIKANLYVEGLDPGLRAVVDSMFGLRLDVPAGYKVAVKRKNVLWLRKDFHEGMQSLILWKKPYRDTQQLNTRALIDDFNAMGKMIKTDIPDDRVVVDDRHFPVYRFTRKIGGLYAVELRGIWMTQKDFFGGPFVMTVLVDPQRRELLYLAGLVWAPAKDKRDLIQQLSFLINTVRPKAAVGPNEAAR